MSSVETTTIVQEKSTCVVQVVFKDEDGDLVVPDSIAWSLLDRTGTVINSRTGVAVAVPASTIEIVLSNLDLAFQTGESGSAVRSLLVQAVYDSDNGNNLPMKDTYRFLIEDLVGVT